MGFDGQVNEAGKLITCKRNMKKLNQIHLKYVDELSLAEAVNLKELGTTPVECRPQPDPYHARTGHTLEPDDSKVYTQLLRTQQYAEDNRMKLNPKKTKLMLFNPAKAYDFMPSFIFNNEEI